MASVQPEMKKIPVPLKEVACQEMLRSGVVHHGNLRKRRKVDEVVGQMAKLFKWKQIYVVLRDGCIYFYNDETSTKARAFSLYGFTSVECCQAEVAREVLWPFKLVCALQERDRNYYFSAPSEKDLNTWMKRIEEQIQYANGFSTSSPSTRSTVGLVHPMHTTGGGKVEKNPQRPLPTVPGQKPVAAVYCTDSSSSEEEDIKRKDKTKKSQAVTKKTDGHDDRGNRDSVYEVVDLTGNKGLKKPAERAVSVLPPLETRTPSVPGKVARVLPEASVVKPTVPLNKKPPITPKPAEKSPAVSAEDTSGAESIYVTTENCRKEVLDTADESTLELAVSSAYWDKDTNESEQIMKSIASDGVYMIREATDNSTNTLMVCIGKGVRKYRIVKSDNKFSMESAGPYFDSLAQMINHYKKNDVPHQKTKLTIPYSSVTK